MIILREFLEDLGGKLQYRFSLLPKWARAFILAAALTAFVFAALGGIALLLIAFVQWGNATFGPAAMFIGFIAFVCFLFFLAVVWDDVKAEKPKNSEGEK